MDIETVPDDIIDYKYLRKMMNNLQSIQLIVLRVIKPMQRN